MSGTTTYLITGANRGLGFGLTKALCARTNTVVIAAVRDLGNSSASSLRSLHVASDSRLVLTQIDLTAVGDAAKAVTHLRSNEAIDIIDVVVACAGICKYNSTMDVSADEIEEHVRINLLGPLTLFQAVTPLLQRSKKAMFIPITSGLGSINDAGNVPHLSTAYGGSKAMLNFVFRKIHFENPWVITFLLNPGWVETDMGKAGAKALGIESGPMISVEESIEGQLQRIDGATRETMGGKAVSYDGSHFNW